MEKEVVLREFLENRLNSTDIASKYNVSKKEVLDYLRDELGSTKLKRIAQSNAAIKTNKNLDYVKLGKTISNSVRSKMAKDDSYSIQWKLKAKNASKLARKKVRTLLNNNAEFKQNWLTNWRKGGLSTFNNQKGFWDPKNLDKRRRGSLRGIKNMGKMVIGPLGEKMYNGLELEVAGVLKKLNINYEYEKRFITGKGNGYFSCDFFCEFFERCFFIETTYWDKPEEKSNKLNKKFKFYKSLNLSADFIVVTTEILKEKYSNYLDEEIVVFSFDEFKKGIEKAIKPLIARGGGPNSEGWI